MKIEINTHRLANSKQEITSVFTGSQDHNLKLLKILPCPVVITDANNAISFVNFSFSEATGFEAKEIVGKVPPYPFWPEEKCESYLEVYPDREETMKEWRMQKKNRETFWVRIGSVAIKDQEGAKFRLDLWHDATELQQVQRSLKLAEDKFALFFNAIPIPLAISSFPEMKFLDVNESFIKVGGFSRSEIIGQLAPQLNWGDGFDADQATRKIQEERTINDIEMQLFSKTGKLHTSLMSARVVSLEGEDYLLSASVDITDRKKAEKALKESEARFRMLSENSLSGIFIFRQDHFSYVNPAFASMLGRPRDELTGCDPSLFVHPEDQELISETTIKRLRGEQTHVPYTFRCLHGDGKIIWLEVLSTRFEDEGQPALLGTVLDITEQRQAEEEADRIRQLMEHVSRINTLGEIATSIAHELNQPLTAIMANAKTALRMIKTGKVNLEEIKGILEDITSDDRRAGDIIRRMREPLKRRELTLELLDVNNLIKEIYPLVRNDALIAGVTIDLKLASGLPMIRGDQTQLQQVLLNLLVNALDAVKEQIAGHRWIEVRSSADSGRFVKVEIIDSGPGISEINRERLFEPLFTTKSDGLGVGLSICKSLIEAHGGRIWEEDRPEGGATFAFTLPVDQGIGENR